MKEAVETGGKFLKAKKNSEPRLKTTKLAGIDVLALNGAKRSSGVMKSTQENVFWLERQIVRHLETTNHTCTKDSTDVLTRHQKKQNLQEKQNLQDLLILQDQLMFAKKTEKLALSLLLGDAKEEANFSVPCPSPDTNACKWPRWTQNVETSTPTMQTNPATVKRKKERMLIAQSARTDNTESTEWRSRLPVFYLRRLLKNLWME